MIFVTSDLHLGHNNIIEYCKRPFNNIKEHDDYLINKWNSVVTNNDEVYVIGDFIFEYNPDNAARKLERFNGQINWIPGNHCYKIYNKLKNHADYYPHINFCKDIEVIKINNQGYVLCHYPIEVWPKRHYGDIHLHGHSHGHSRKEKNRYDIGVDVYKGPIPIDIGELDFTDRKWEI